MVRPRIFVSHSSGEKKCADHGCECIAYRDAVATLLTEVGCDPVVDQDVLKTNSGPWHPKLLRELFSCQGTVVLLSPHALESDYVFEEAQLSMALWEVREDGFLVLPVMLPGVRRGHLKKSRLARLDLGRFDMVDWPPLAEATAPPTKVGERLRALVEQHGSLPHPKVTEYIANRIEDVSAAALSDIARELGVAHIAYASDHANYVVSAGLLTERPVDGFGAACAMRKALVSLLPLLRHKEHRQDVVDVVVPFARVPRAAASQLRTLRDTSQEDRVALLTARRTATAEMYVRRASESPAPWPLHTPVPRPGMDFVTGVITDIHEFLADRFFVFDALDDEVHEWLARKEKESGPVTIVLGVQPDAEMVRRLLAAFPKLLFLFSHNHVDASPGTPEHARLQALSLSQEHEMLSTHREFSP
ncbi:toll/interleukin-1 receptor domain-containing protein [Streptomyces phaeochromogenes]|uniref:toll/interleukin-1 receptor domain-containing protein n=1 Tax=Streptomyces phaeochromogenes TaxID=1923 RepID=UPI002E14581F|nr:toll/interleukin-1 receptor domain-containing protein [Streptomyces phaeochromogenes]